MQKNVNYIVWLYLSNKNPQEKLDLLANHLFRYCTKEVSSIYKQGKAVNVFINIESLLFCPRNEFREFAIDVDDLLVDLTEKDYDLVNKVAEKINQRYMDYYNRDIKYCKYQKVFEEWASNIHPSHQNKGNWTHKQIDDAQKNINALKDKYKALYERMRTTCLRYNTSVNVVMYIASKRFYLIQMKDGYYQLNLKNNDILLLLNEYYALTNCKPYANEYDKISLIRSCLNDLAFFCFKKDFEVSKEGYFRMKFHSRIVCNLKKKDVGSNETKSIYNYFISFNNINNLLHKLPILSKFNRNKNTNKLVYIKDSALSINNNSS